MRPDDDDFAAIVVAQQFQLVDGSGNIDADFNSVDPTTLTTTLNFRHNDPTRVSRDSYLFWSQNSPTERLSLNGPTNLTTGLHSALDFANANGTGQASASLSAAPALSSLVLAAGPGATGFGQLVAVGSMLVSGGTSMDVSATGAGAVATLRSTAANVVVTAGTTVDLNPTTGVNLNARAAYLLVGFGNATGGDTGAVAGAATVLLCSTPVFQAHAGDVIEIDAGGWVSSSVGATFSGLQLYVSVNGGADAATGYSAQQATTTGGNGWTISIPPYQVLLAAGNYQFKLKLDVAAGGNYRCISSQIRGSMYSTK